MTDAVSPQHTGVPEQTLVVIGDITASKNWLVTPSGTRTLQGTQVHLSDLSSTTNKIPTWAIVCAIVGTFFFLLGLLFLLVRETQTTGVVQVTVTNGTLVHLTQLPVTSTAAVVDIHGRVSYLRQLVSAAS